MNELAWFTSSYSTSEGGNCVEVAPGGFVVRVRDSKDPEGPALAFGVDAWASFVAYARTATVEA